MVDAPGRVPAAARRRSCCSGGGCAGHARGGRAGIRWWRRSSMPAGATTSRSTSSTCTSTRCASTAHRCACRPGTNWSATCAAAPARWAASWARCSARREASTSRSSAWTLAFQLTNFVRDVREDWELDRVYMPAEDLERFGVSTTQIASREPTPGSAPARPRGRACSWPLPESATGAARLAKRPARHVDGSLGLRGGPTASSGSASTCCATGGGAAAVGARGRRGDGAARERMTRRATLRGPERTSLDGMSADVLVCGSSFAGLAVARELAAAGPMSSS